jgi:hypothetical protein
MLPENWDPGSAALLQAYVREFPEVTPFKGACLGLFLLQHVAIRFTYDSSDTHSQSLMTELMSNIAARLETSLQHSAVNRP